MIDTGMAILAAAGLVVWWGERWLARLIDTMHETRRARDEMVRINGEIARAAALMEQERFAEAQELLDEAEVRARILAGKKIGVGER